MLSDLIKDIQILANPQKAKTFLRFFKTGKGEYGEGDKFLGLTVPSQRLIAKKYKEMELEHIEKVLSSPFHEYRLIALMILIYKFKKADEKDKKIIFDLYLKNTKYINNWDLVDLSAPNIVGNYLLDRDRNILYKLAKSDCLWEKRIAIISTYAFIRNSQFNETLEISKILLNDKHDLIHKAVGWMLREIGKRNVGAEKMFLKENYQQIPRTALRYAIEKFPEDLRLAFLKGNFF